MLHIDRATDLPVAVCYGPSHARLGEKDGQHAAQPYVFIGLAMTIFARAKPRQSAVSMAMVLTPTRVVIAGRRSRMRPCARRSWGRSSRGGGLAHQAAAARDIAMGEPVGLSSGPRSAKRLSGFARDAGEHECSMSPRSSEETINSYSYV